MRTLAKKQAVTGRARVMTATGAIGKSIGELLGLLEKHGAEITHEEFHKVWTFLHHTLGTIEVQARKDRLVIAAGEFSFDSPPGFEVPPSPYMGERAERHGPTETHTSSGTPRAPASTATPLSGESNGKWIKPTGRISKNSPNQALAGKVTHAPVSMPTIPDQVDKDISLIDSADEKKKEL